MAGRKDKKTTLPPFFMDGEATRKKLAVFCTLALFIFSSFSVALQPASFELEDPFALLETGARSDSDGDNVSDGDDECPNGVTGWNSTSVTDHDSDGCRDSDEDGDDDNDGVLDNDDTCAKGVLGWTSSTSTDHDGDGCRDNTPEDSDDDNDSIPDGSDDCPTGEVGWTPSSSTDYDSDGFSVTLRSTELASGNR